MGLLLQLRRCLPFRRSAGRALTTREQQGLIGIHWFEKKKRDERWLTQVITAAKNPVQMDAVAAKAPCLDEKNVPTNAGSADPVKIPVIF